MRHSPLALFLLGFLAGGCAFNPRASTGGEDGGAAGASATTGAGGGLASTGGGGSSVVTGAAGGGTGTGSTTGAGGVLATSGTGGASGASSCNPTGPQCNNCKDDDGDGLVDALDPECVGAFDNDEGTFGTGIPGDNMDPCLQDCFFDGNSGAGDDGCNWNLKCDPLSPGAGAARACPYDSNYRNCPGSQSQKCLNTCRTVTPNGCDCFGCCLVPDAPNAIYLAPTCTAADFADPTKCPPCTQVTACLNTCGHCEICVGKPTLPADCTPPPPTGAGGASGTGGIGGTGGDTPCAGQPYCGPNGIDPASCPAGTYCVTGCCVPVIP